MSTTGVVSTTGAESARPAAGTARIAVDCRMSGKSGIGAFIDGILPFFIRSGNELLLLLPPEGLHGSSLREAADAAPNVRTLCCPQKPFSLQELLFFPRGLARQINACDVYFSPYCNIPAGIRIPVYSTIHDIVFLDMPELAGRAGTFVRAMFYRYAIYRSKELFTVSEFSRGRIREKLRCKKTVHVVYSALPESISSPVTQRPPKTDTVIFIGNIKKHKGLALLLQAFGEFRKGFPSGAHRPQLVIVGSQEHFRTKDSAAQALLQNAEEEGITFTGHIGDAELKTLLMQARVLAQPSLYEGFGLPPLQALCCGTNAVISDIPVFKEIYSGFPVTFFSAGDTAALAQKLREAWENPDPPPPFPQKYTFSKTASRILSVLAPATKDTAAYSQ